VISLLEGRSAGETPWGQSFTVASDADRARRVRGVHHLAVWARGLPGASALHRPCDDPGPRLRARPEEAGFEVRAGLVNVEPTPVDPLRDLHEPPVGREAREGRTVAVEMVFEGVES
jgi:hypothetical protein